MADNPNEDQVINDCVLDAMAKAQAATTYDEAMSSVTEAVTLSLYNAMTACGLPDPDRQITLLQRTGLDRLLVETLQEKRLTPAATDRYLCRAKAALRAGEFDSETLKLAITTFDGVAQRLSLAGESSESVYPTRGNPGRDLLIGFACSLHR